MIQCSRCGQQNNDSEFACTRCGMVLSHVESTLVESSNLTQNFENYYKQEVESKQENNIDEPVREEYILGANNYNNIDNNYSINEMYIEQNTVSKKPNKILIIVAIIVILLIISCGLIGILTKIISNNTTNVTNTQLEKNNVNNNLDNLIEDSTQAILEDNVQADIVDNEVSFGSNTVGYINLDSSWKEFKDEYTRGTSDNIKQYTNDKYIITLAKFDNYSHIEYIDKLYSYMSYNSVLNKQSYNNVSEMYCEDSDGYKMYFACYNMDDKLYLTAIESDENNIDEFLSNVNNIINNHSSNYINNINISVIQ